MCKSAFKTQKPPAVFVLILVLLNVQRSEFRFSNASCFFQWNTARKNYFLLNGRYTRRLTAPSVYEIATPQYFSHSFSCSAAFISTVYEAAIKQNFATTLSSSFRMAAQYKCHPRWLPSKTASVNTVYYLDFSQRVRLPSLTFMGNATLSSSQPTPFSIQMLLHEFRRNPNKYRLSGSTNVKQEVSPYTHIPSPHPSLVGILYCTTWNDYCKAMVAAIESTALPEATPYFLILRLYNSIVVAKGKNSRKRQLRMLKNQKQLRHHEQVLKLMIDEHVTHGKGKIPTLSFYNVTQIASPSDSLTQVKLAMRIEGINEGVLQSVTNNPVAYTTGNIVSEELLAYLQVLVNNTRAAYQNVLETYPREPTYNFIKLR